LINTLEGTKMNICTLTESAKRQIDLLCAENDCYAISLNLKGGGCAGFEYQWSMIKDPADIESGDEIISTDGAGKFVISGYSIMFLIGTEIDYVRSLVGSNFEVKNPNAKSSCGCGISVNFDVESLPQVIS
jgi:iron-sulfur cluster assembly accessory protein